MPELADDPRFARNEDRTANRDELRPLLVERLRDPDQDGVVPRHHRGRACRAGRSTPSTAASRSPRRSASTRWSTSARATPRCRRCATRSRSPRPRPTTGCRRRRSTSTAPRSARWLADRGGRRMTEPTLQLPDLARHLRRRPDPAARPGPHRRPDGQGRLRRAGLLAGRAAAADARRRPGSSRRCWSRWPTTASPRPRSPPG